MEQTRKTIRRRFMATSGLIMAGMAPFMAASAANDDRPNILFIMSDDHTSQAVSAYGGILANVLPTPNIDRIAKEGALLTNCFVTNSISTPSRGAIITGQYSQCNGVYTLSDALDPSHPNVAKYLRHAGYQTAIVGKWHLHAEPTGFDYYNVLPGQGRYNNPVLIEKGMWGPNPRADVTEGKEYEGHSTDVIASQAIGFMERCDKKKPFFLMCHFKAPHRNWIAADRFKNLLKDVTVPEPDNLFDSYEGKALYTDILRLRIEDMRESDVKQKIPDGLSRNEKRRWIYQYYIKDYLRCIAGIDENVGRLLKYLDDNGLTENTIVIYTGDQGFFLGEHGWFDKRLMYEECLRAPFLIRYPKEIKAGTICNDMILNIDYAPLFLDYAGVRKPVQMQGESFRTNVAGGITPASWRQAMYYRYWMNGDGSHNVPAMYGIRTQRYKLTYVYARGLGKTGTDIHKVFRERQPLKPEWELYDLQNDPGEMHNIYNDPANKALINELKHKLLELKKQYHDEDDAYTEMMELDEKYYW